jgi:hypothetical protein
MLESWFNHVTKAGQLSSEVRQEAQSEAFLSVMALLRQGFLIMI